MRNQYREETRALNTRDDNDSERYIEEQGATKEMQNQRLRTCRCVYIFPWVYIICLCPVHLCPEFRSDQEGCVGLPAQNQECCR